MLKFTHKCIRYYCKSSYVSEAFNPLNKKYRKSAISTEIPRVCVTILGNGAYGQQWCVGLFTEYRGFLFNCGEGIGRLCREYDIPIHKIRHIFITQKKWRNMSGVPDVYLTNEVSGVSKMTLYGPPGINMFTSLVSSCRFTTHILTKDKYDRDGMEIFSIPIKQSSPVNLQQQRFKSFDANDTVYNYVCKIPKFNGELNWEKCIKKGLPIGPLLLKLKEGQDVYLPSGKIVHPADVLDFAQSTTIFLIADCPSESFLDTFVSENQFSQYQLPADNASNVYAIFHFSPSHIVKTPKYQEWMNRFHQETIHYMLNSSEPTMSSGAVYETQRVLNLLHPQIFRNLKSKVVNQNSLSKIVEPPSMLQIHLRPEKKTICDNVSGTCVEEYIELLENIPEFKQHIKSVQSKMTTQFLSQDKGSPEVLFLGTSSATSTPFRNVSSILLTVKPNLRILLDCGEGTFGQLVRYYGNPEVKTVLQDISCIFITHKHTDHYLGLFELIKSRVEAFESTGTPYRPVAVILPSIINNIMMRFYDIFESLKPFIRIYSCYSLTSERSREQLISQFLGDITFETVPVRHCKDAYGAVIELPSQWKIVYSGDTAPCQKLVDAGMNCNLLIHEASIEDNFLSEANAKKHSTPAQVIDISRKMNAEFTIMTHFSKRYLSVPPVFTDNLENFGCAFDFMRVRLSELPLLPYFLPALKCLFQDQYDSNLEKSSTFASSENNFLKAYIDSQKQKLRS